MVLRGTGFHLTSHSENTTTDDSGRSESATVTATATSDDGDGPVQDETAGWFAASALRIGLELVGFVLLLVALGQIVGVNFLEMVTEVLTSPIGRWLVVAVVALLIISFAVHGFGRWYR